MVAASTAAVLPGMILNLGKKVRYYDAWLGAEREVNAGGRASTGVGGVGSGGQEGSGR